jgi:hypothetical protein
VSRIETVPAIGTTSSYIVTTNHLEFWVEHGIVTGYRTPRSYYDLQDPRRVPEFYGPLNLDDQDAIVAARRALSKLGYNLKDVFADQQPTVSRPPPIGTNLVAYYSVQWTDPLRDGPGVSIDLSAVDGTIDKIRLFSNVFWRNKAAGSRNTSSHAAKVGLSPGVANDPRIQAATDASAALVRHLALSVHTPITANQVEQTQFNGETIEALDLTNGYQFFFWSGHIAGFASPDSYYGPERGQLRLPISAYVGTWNMTMEQALDLARETVRRSGLIARAEVVHDPPTSFLKPPQVGSYVIPRYCFIWITRSETNSAVMISRIQVEVDADLKVPKLLQIWDASGGAEVAPVSRQAPNGGKKGSNR